MALYRATARGYIKGLGVIEPGQEFEFNGKPGKWMEKVKGKPGRPSNEEKKDKETKPSGSGGSTGDKTVI